jgi:environmental stress-induced protein Ves
MSPRIIEVDQTPEQPWKNGGGTTRELLCWPSQADWSLRISVAEITRDGAFSAFPNVIRYFAVLTGQGLWLGDRPTVITTDMQPIQFAGEIAPMCRLTNGPTRDLNVMARTGCTVLSFQMQSVDQQRPAVVDIAPGTNFIALFSVSPCNVAVNGNPITMPAMSLCIVPPSPKLLILVSAAGVSDARLYALCATLQR